MQREAFAALLDRIPNFSIMTSWQEARHAVRMLPEYDTDPLLKDIDDLESFSAYQDKIRPLETKWQDTHELMREQQRAGDRRNRDAFEALLSELEASNMLHADSTWEALREQIMEDLRYTAMLGQPGSSALDLFMLRLHDLRDRLHTDKRVVKDVLKDADFEVTPNTTWEEYTAALGESVCAAISPMNLKIILNALQSKAELREREMRRMEKAIAKRKLAAFRLLLRDAKPPINENTTWAEVREQIMGEPAFEDISTEAEREALFAEHKQEEPWKALADKEKEKEKEKEREREREKAKEGEGSDSSSDEHRRHRSSRHRRRSHSPADGDSDEDHKRKRRKDKKKSSSKKKRRHHSPSSDRSGQESGSESELERKRLELLAQLSEK